MNAVVSCPQCSQKLRVPHDRGALRVKCRRCAARFVYEPGQLAAYRGGGSVARPETPRGGIREVTRADIATGQPSGLTAAQMGKFGGQLRPRHVPSPRAELAFIDFVCAVHNRPFTVTLAKENLGEPFHVKSLEGREYRDVLEASGYTVTEVRQGDFDVQAADWTGFQCEHCGAGSVVGAETEFYETGCCGLLTCAGRAQPVHAGGFKNWCPRCRAWHMIGADYVTHVRAGYSLTDKPDHAAHDTKPQAGNGIVSRMLRRVK